MRTIILEIDNHKIRVGAETEIPIENSNLPMEAMTFTSVFAIYWEAEMISFSKANQSLRLRILNYQSSASEKIEHQKSKYEIKYIEFEPLNWERLSPILATYQKSRLSSILYDSNLAVATPHISSISLKVPLSKLSFGMGKVSFHKDFPWRRPKTEISMLHPESIPEFEHIKFYFIKILGKGTVDIDIKIESTPTSTKIKYVTSSDLQKINADAVQVLKIRKIEEWASKRPKIDQPDKGLFTFEEAMKSYGDEALGNLDSLEKDMLFHLIEKESIRNKMQLRYLSEDIQHADKNLWMTLVPQFGFMFSHVGDQMNHFIWELLNSHATYVWSVPSNTGDKAINQIENEIKTITVHGRQYYRDHFEPHEDLFFHAIRHKSSQYSYEAYFAKWKKELDALLI